MEIHSTFSVLFQFILTTSVSKHLSSLFIFCASKKTISKVKYVDCTFGSGIFTYILVI